MKRVLTGIILVITICLLVLIISDSFFIKERKKIETVEKTEEKVKEEIIKDVNLKEDLEQKINFLSNFNYCEIKSNQKYYNGCLYSKNKITASELSSKYKIYSLVLANKPQDQLEEEKQINEEIYLINAKLEESKIKELYQKLYGELDTYNPTFINELKNVFPVILYNEGEFYFINSEKENVLDNEVVTYINKYTTKEDKAYVYISTAFVKMIKDGNDKIVNYEVYSDYNMTNLKEEGLYSEYRKEIKNEDGSVSVITAFKINKENYKDYNQYRFTFQKNESGNYYFEKIELIK